MSDVVGLVTRALRHKLMTEGIESMTAVEWHLLRVSRLLLALEQRAVEPWLGQVPLTDLRALAEGLDAIEAPEAAAAVRKAGEGIAAITIPGVGGYHPAAIRQVARLLSDQMAPLRSRIERNLIDYAFGTSEIALDGRTGERDPSIPSL
jgi:hypothetical protein